MRTTVFLIASLALPAAADPPGKVRLVVRGDDFGYTHASNEAMARAFDARLMTSASVLVPGPWFAETAALLRSRPDESIGVHLTVTSEWNRLRWRPVSTSSAVPSLLAPDGGLWGFGYGRPRPADWPADGAPWAEHEPNPTEVEAEFRAQIEGAKRAGVRIDYVDCHMGIGCREELYPIVERLARENCLAISGGRMLSAQRFPFERVDNSVEEAKRLMAQGLRGLKPGLWLLVAHPAVDSPELRSVDSNDGERWAKRRSAVLAAWTDPEIRALVDELGIELVSMRDLFDYESCRPKEPRD